MHDHHENLPGFSAGQILHSGCGVCEGRSKSSSLGIAYLDRTTFARAWARAAQYNRAGVPDLSLAEMPMLDVLRAVQCQLENYGVPIGTVPRDYLTGGY
jgi:hypothetical protein